MASSSRPLDKNIVEANGRLKLEWDAYFKRIEDEVASLAAQITSGGVPSTRQVISGAGLTGGGDLSADRTLEVGAGTGITVAADSVSTNDAEIVHDDLSGFVADEHVAHSGVTLTAGAGLTGGGDISASRSFAVGAGTGITVNADDVAITAGGVGTTQLADEGVTMAKLEHAAAYTLLMRNAGTAGDPAYTKISALTNSSGFGSGDKLMIEESSGELRKIDYDNLPGASGGSPGLVLLTSGSVAAQATLDIVLTAYTAYRGLVFELVNFIPATDDVDLQVRFSSNGGASYDAGASDYRYVTNTLFSNGVSHVQNSTGAAQILITGASGGSAHIGNGAAEGVSATVKILGQTNTAIKTKVYAHGSYYGAGDFGTVFSTGGHRNTAQDTDAVRFLFSSGNITSGVYAVYGLA